MTWGKRDKESEVETRMADDDIVGVLRFPAKAKFFFDGKRRSLEGFSLENPHAGRLLESSRSAAKRCQAAFKLTATSCQQNLLTLPQVAVETATRTLEETATHCQRNIQTIGEVLQENRQKYQRQLQETASNCQQNVAQLGDILHQSFPWEQLQQAARNGSESSLRENLFPQDVFAIKQKMRVETARQEAAEIEDLLAQEWAKPRAKGRARQRRASSLRDPGRMLAIVTTACLPWMTGTSVNPLLRAAYLANDKSRKVTLVVPWLSQVDQAKVFPNGISFETPEQQEDYVRKWVEKRTGLKSTFKLTFYPGRFAPEKCSILPVGDLTQCIPDHEADVAVLEEPEHLNWYHHGRRWTDKFNHVVGIMHTNYLDYARREENGEVKEGILHRVNQWVTRVHCHHVVKLSDAVQPLPRQRTEFVHGVSPSFLEVGKRRARDAGAEEIDNTFSKGVYFLGKVLWAKGYTELVDLLSKHATAHHENFKVDIYGSGQDSAEVQQEAVRRNLDMTFFGARDHADSSIDDYKIFVNPCTSDVVATTTAEALAMGKFVICADHPCNRFFSTFQNCLIYKNPEEFSQCVSAALASEPKPLSEEEQTRLTWEAATERFLDVTELTPHDRPRGLQAVVDNMCWAVHNSLTGVEPLRVVAGAGANTRDTPQRVVDYVPTDDDCGGILDRKKKA
ncbi:hypothetical protein BSKO_04529 [Bryopsis sp. KO-2023]|nr:hypothetical protein BSKO_04529 [Bryopsis sp. KO-2023]